MTRIRAALSHLRTQVRHRHPAERGFALIEALAALVVLAIVFVVVLGGVDSASRTSGREKSRSVASALAEKDQERMHAMPASALPNYRLTQSVAVGGTTYSVVSQADWVADANGGTVSCTTVAGKADYLRLRTVVTSNVTGARTAPIQMDSLVAPPVGTAGANTGTLAVQIKDRDDQPVTTLPVSIVGATYGRSFSAQTNTLGCAVFGNVPADTYDVQVSRANWVDPQGTTDLHYSGTVNVNQISLVGIKYDRQGSVKTNFASTYTDTSTGKPQIVRAWDLSLSNAAIPSGLRTFGDGVTASSPLTASALFPFKDGYSLFAGSCSEENPSNYASAWATTNAFQFVDRGIDYDRTTITPAGATMPQLNVKITKSGTAFTTANVAARLIVTSSSTCNKKTDAGLAYSGNEVITSSMIRPYNGTLTAWKGYVSKSWATNTYDAGFPFGTWWVCADDGTRRAFARVDNTGTSGSPAVTIAIPTSGTTALGTCASSGWVAV